MRADLDLFNEFWLRTEREEAFAPYRNSMRKARPFALSDEIDEMVGSLSFGKDDIKTLRHLSSAKLPYPVMWLEHGNGGFGRRVPPMLDTLFGTPQRTGWLLLARDGDETGAKWEAVRVSRVRNELSGDMTASLYPLMHRVSTADKLEDFTVTGPSDGPLGDAYAMFNHMQADTATTAMIGWGGGDKPLISDDEDEQERILRSSPLFGHASVVIDPGFMRKIVADNYDPKSGVVRMVKKAAVDHYGELRYLVAALALMNEVPVEFVPFRPSGHVRLGGRLRPFMSSSVVSITVPASRRRLKDIDKLLQQRGEAAKKARHEVRGHFRHAKTLPATNPERWERAEDRDGRPVWRTWIGHHMRGSAELGWVEQRYAVVPKHPEQIRLTADDHSDR